MFALDIFSDFHATVCCIHTSESQQSKTENSNPKLKSSTVVYWASDAFQLRRSRFKADLRAHADSCPSHPLWPWWEWRIIKLLTTGEKRQEWLDTSQSNSHHLLHNDCNTLLCDFDYKGVKLASHHWTLASTLRASCFWWTDVVCSSEHFSILKGLIFWVPLLQMFSTLMWWSLYCEAERSEMRWKAY